MAPYTAVEQKWLLQYPMGLRQPLGFLQDKGMLASLSQVDAAGGNRFPQNCASYLAGAEFRRTIGFPAKEGA